MRLTDIETVQNIVSFDGTNYAEWSTQVKFRLMERGLWTHIADAPLKPQKYKEGEVMKMETKESERYKKRVTANLKLDDQKALGVIGKSVKPEFAESIGQAETAAEAWMSLQQIYEGNSAGSLLACRSEFYKLKMGDSEDIVSYLGKLERIQRLCNQRLCKKSKAPINDEELIVKLVHSLPKSFDSFCQGLRSNRNLLESYQVIKEQLVSEWQAKQTSQDGNESLHSSPGSPRNSSSMGNVLTVIRSVTRERIAGLKEAAKKVRGLGLSRRRRTGLSGAAEIMSLRRRRFLCR